MRVIPPVARTANKFIFTDVHPIKYSEYETTQQQQQKKRFDKTMSDAQDMQAFMPTQIAQAQHAFADQVHSSIVAVVKAETSGSPIDKMVALSHFDLGMYGFQQGALDVNSAIVKGLLPEFTLLELKDHLKDIYDVRTSKGMTVEDLKDYAAHCDQKPIEKESIQYAIDHFDQIKRLGDSGTAGITESTIDTAMAKFAKIEVERPKIDELEEERPALTFLNDQKNYDAIHTHKDFAGISEFEIEHYMQQNCSTPGSKNEALEYAQNNFTKLRNLDPSDGDTHWYIAWLMRANADGITQQDVSAGMAQLKDAQAKAAKLQAQVDEMMK